MHVDLSKLSRDALLRLNDLCVCPDDECPFPPWLRNAVLRERASRSADCGPFHTDVFLAPPMTLEEAQIFNRGLVGASLGLEAFTNEQGPDDGGSREAAQFLASLSQGLATDCVSRETTVQ